MKQSTSFAQVATNQFDYLSSALCANTPPFCKKHSSSRKFLTLSISLRLLFAMFLTLTVTTNAWGATLTLNNLGSSLSTTSNPTISTTTITATGDNKSSYVINYLQCKKQSNGSSHAMLLAKSTGAFISNKTAMPGNIKSVTVYVLTGASKSTTYHCAFSTTECTSAYTNGSTAVNIAGGNSNKYTCTVSNAKYFCISLGNANHGQVYKLDVEYETAAATTYTVTLNPNYPEGKTGVFKDKSDNTIDGNLVLSYPSGTASMQITSLYNSLTLDGYEFGGWYNATGVNPGEVSGSKCTNTGTITGNKTYYAKWTQKVYTVTATSNNNNYGTVSVSGTTITASPKTGYTYANPAYTVTSGSATVSQNGNTFSVTPSSDCTITINFEAIPQNTVKWSIKGNITTTDLSDGTTNMPDDPLNTSDDYYCGAKKFVGWSDDEVTDGNKPTILFKKTDGIPNSITLYNGITFYAVYANKDETTTITYTWDLVKQSTTPALATGDQIVIAAKSANYALSTTQNTDDRDAAAITKDGEQITFAADAGVQVFTLEEGYVEETFALATGSGYLSGTRRKSGRNYVNQLKTDNSKESANASWFIGFTEETTPYIRNEVTETNKNKTEYPQYYVQFNYTYNWWTSTYTYFFDVVRDASDRVDYNPENISIYRKTKHEETSSGNSGYTTDCGCSVRNDLSFANQTIQANETLTLAPATNNNGSTITYTCSDTEHTTINGDQFTANALGTYTITATQGVNGSICGTVVNFTVTVTCAAPEINPSTYTTNINTPVNLASIITSTSTMPLTFACTSDNSSSVYISGSSYTFLAADDYTITASQAAGGIYCAGSQTITIEVEDPCAGKTKPSVNASNITTDGFKLSWSSLSNVSSYRIYNNTTGDSDETTSTSYTFSGLNPGTEYSWTVEAVYSDGCTAATSGTTTTTTPTVKYTVGWNVNGSSYSTGNPTTSVTHGAKVSQLPTDPTTIDCGDKAFVGWSKSQYLDGTRPADLFTTAEGSPAITAATTFYAVFADCVTGGETPEDDTSGEYTLVTDVSDLQAGDKIVIACYSENVAAGNLTSAILGVDEGVTFSNSNTLTPSESTLILTLGGSSGAWTLANSSGQLLGATAVKKLAWDGGTTTWRISISGNNATIQNGTDDNGRFLYNVTSPRFTTYTSSTSESMLLPQIYKKTGSGSGGGETPEPEEYTVTLSVLGNIEGTPTTTGEYTLPSTVSGTCAGKTFVGWTTTENLSSSTEPTSNYWAKGTPVTITEDKTYYAVFATESTGGGESVEQTMIFSKYFEEDGEDATTYAYVAGEGDEKVAVEFDWGTNENNCPTYYNNGAAVRMYEGNNIVVYHRNETLPLTKIQFTFSSTTYDNLSLDDTGVYDSETCTWIGSQTEVWFTATDGARIQSVIITIGGGTTYSDYSTTCESGGETPDPETTYTVSFNAGTGTCTTQSLKETSEGVGVTLPTATGCGDWTFAGWWTSEVTETTSSPGTLLDANTNYKPTSNTTLYAVYSKTESSGGEVLAQTLSYDTWTYEGSTTNQSTQSYRLFHSGSYVESAAFDLSTLTKVIVYGGTYGGDNYNKLTITGVVGDNISTWKSVTVSGSNQNGVNTYTNGTTLSGTGKLRVTSNSGSSSNSGVRMSKVEIYTSSGGSSTIYYNSNPDCESGGGGGDAQTGTTTFIVKSSTTLTSPWTDSDGSTWTYSGVSFGSTVNDAYFPKNSFATVTLPSGCVATQIIVNRTSNAWSNKVSLDITSGATEITTISAPSTTTTITLENSKQYNTYTFAHGNEADNKIWMDYIEIHYTSTPASAPARKVAMKKATAVKAEKSEMVTRPVLKAPAALAAQECTSYENYTTICCAYPITDLKYSAGANSITLYWTTAAPSATATLYSDEECTDQEGEAQTSTSGTCTFTGLAKTTTYYAKVTTDDGCTAVLEVSTERPHVSVAEWGANQINIDVNTNEPITVVLENEVTGGSTSGNQATELFFSKYYEATGNVKLVAVYNGTSNAIDLTNYTIKYGKSSWESSYITLADFATDGEIQPGEEIILYTMYTGDNRDVQIMNCVNSSYPDGTWVEVTNTNNEGGGKLSFGGDKTIALFKEGEMIDIIGAGTASQPNITGATVKPSWGDKVGWTCDEGLSIDDGTMIGLSTNRCLLVRNNTVTSGDAAVASNTSTFATLCTEWKGAHVPDDDADDGVGASCENFAFVGTFDYSDYYVQYEQFATSDELDTKGRLDDGTYAVTTPNLHDIACTNMRISLKGESGNTLVTQDLKVPIIIDKNVSTKDPIYFEYTQREDVNTEPELPKGQNENILTPEICADCDVVIRDGKTLTHEEGGVSQFNNMMVYPGAKLDNNTSQSFYLNSLQMQAKNDEVAYAIINNDGSSIDVGDMVFVKRIDDKYWYQFSLPYDCKVADIIQQNGQSMGKYWVDWGIKEYNGKRRQAEGTASYAGQVSNYWEKVEETATLKAHQGYIIGLFTTEWTNQMKFVYFTPATTNPYREAGDDAKTTQVESWYIADIPETDAPRHHGWNYTGSPYISIFNHPKTDPPTPPYYGESSVLMSGTFDPANPDAEYISGDVYLSIPVLPDGLYYDQVVASSTSLMPFRAYFVQTIDPESADEQHTLTYVKNGRHFPPASAPARAAATKQRVLVELNITAPDGQTDNTGVWVDERYTGDYEIAADLTKMYVAGTKPQLYTLDTKGDMMAYNALPDTLASNIPLGLYAPMAGEYTLSLNNRVSRLAGAESVELLHDGIVVANMMIQDYTIKAEKGKVEGYTLRIRRRAEVNTAVDNTTGNTITTIVNDGYISITGVPTDATVYIYDMVGHLMNMQMANGQDIVNMPSVPQGVYNIVIANDKGCTTIKSFLK